jgi:integrase
MTEQPIRRQRRKILTDKMVAALPKKRKRYIIADPEQTGHYVRVASAGPSVFCAVTRDQYSKQVWVTLGGSDLLKIEQAREQARLVIGRIKQGLPAIEPPPSKPDSFQTVAESWFKRRVAKNGFRTQVEIKRCLTKYVFPHLGSRVFTDIKRSDITALLDHIEDEHGARQADICLALVRAVGNWYASRNNDYATPVARGMRRDTAKPRDRILDDDELRRVWKAAESSGTFGALVRFLLLCGQRRGAVLGRMRWSDVSADGVWTIATAEREKSNAGALRLPPAALAIIAAQPKLGGNPYVFASLRGDGPLGGLSQAKAAFDKKCGIKENWVLHDLRRTARSLLSRAGVPSEHSERVLGHIIRGVEGIYDRHSYADEKAHALLKLAALIDEIISPNDDKKVVPLRQPAVQP